MIWRWSTRQERIAHSRIARHYAPDHVLLGVCLNDIPEMQNNLVRPPRFLGVLHEHSALVRKLVRAREREIHDVEELFTEASSAAPQALRTLLGLLDDRDERVRGQAVRVLESMRPLPEGAERTLAAHEVRERNRPHKQASHAAAGSLNRRSSGPGEGSVRAREVGYHLAVHGRKTDSRVAILLQGNRPTSAA